MGNRQPRELLTVKEACAAVGVSRRTMYNWMAGGKVEYVRTASGKARIFRDTLYRKGNVELSGNGGEPRTRTEDGG